MPLGKKRLWKDKKKNINNCIKYIIIWLIFFPHFLTFSLKVLKRIVNSTVKELQLLNSSWFSNIKVIETQMLMVYLTAFQTCMSFSEKQWIRYEIYNGGQDFKSSQIILNVGLFLTQSYIMASEILEYSFWTFLHYNFCSFWSFTTSGHCQSSLHGQE